MSRIQVKIAEGKTITLSPGGQNELVSQVIQKFAPQFMPGGRIISVKDTNEKLAYFDEEEIKEIGVAITLEAGMIDPHGKIPGVIIHHTEKDWLILIEVATSHGPINAKRKGELEELFKDSRAGLVFVTAFQTRRAMAKYLDQISWGTDVWIADSPKHMIHFKGDKIFGPY